MQIIPAGKT